MSEELRKQEAVENFLFLDERELDEIVRKVDRGDFPIEGKDLVRDVRVLKVRLSRLESRLRKVEEIVAPMYEGSSFAGLYPETTKKLKQILSLLKGKD